LHQLWQNLAKYDEKIVHFAVPNFISIGSLSYPCKAKTQKSGDDQYL